MIRKALGHIISCKDASRLVSRREDAALSAWQRLVLRLHLSVCVACTALRAADPLPAHGDAEVPAIEARPPEPGPAPTATMQLTVNGTPRTFDRPVRSVAELVRELGLEGKRIAVEKNGEIVPRSRYADTPSPAATRWRSSARSAAAESTPGARSR